MEGKKLDKILDGHQLTMLFELMQHPGWPLLKKLNNAMQQDWIEQTANMNWADKNDEEMIRDLRHKQGQIKGVSLFFWYLEKKMNNKVVQDKKK